jgi:hypothetical protein
MRKNSFFEQLLIYLICPFATLKIIYIALISSRDQNAIKNGKPLAGVKNGAISKVFSVDQIKKKGNKLGSTINDVIMTISSMSIKQYLVKKGDTKTNHVTLAIPFSMRAPPRSKGDFHMDN